MNCRRAIVSLGAALVVALVVPGAASAKVFTVSRDVGVYKQPNLSPGSGVGVIKAGKPVNVECWTNGQAVGGYAIWDRIVGHPSGVAYVHDRYVEMPNGGSPQANVPRCPAGGFSPVTPSQPRPGTCVHGGFEEQYLSAKRVLNPDASLTRVTFEPRLCRESDGWVLRQPPELKQTNTGGLSGLGIEFSAPRRLAADGSTWEYHGRLRKCIPFSIGYSVAGVSVGFSGTGCVTVGTVKLRIVARNGRADAQFLPPRKNGTAETGIQFLWTDRVI